MTSTASASGSASIKPARRRAGKTVSVPGRRAASRGSVRSRRGARPTPIARAIGCAWRMAARIRAGGWRVRGRWFAGGMGAAGRRCRARAMAVVLRGGSASMACARRCAWRTRSVRGLSDARRGAAWHRRIVCSMRRAGRVASASMGRAPMRAPRGSVRRMPLVMKPAAAAWWRGRVARRRSARGRRAAWRGGAPSRRSAMGISIAWAGGCVGRGSVCRCVGWMMTARGRRSAVRGSASRGRGVRWMGIAWGGGGVIR